MENNYILEKIYPISAGLFREGLTAYQKKYVYPKSYALMCVFLVLAANFVYGAVNAPDNVLAYLMVVVSLALAFREWYNPRKMRSSVMNAVRESGEQEYRISVSETAVEFSTIEQAKVENPEGDDDYSDEPVPPSVIPKGENLGILEYEKFFLVVDGKAVFYIVPKENFSEDEREIIRNLKKN